MKIMRNLRMRKKIMPQQITQCLPLLRCQNFISCALTIPPATQASQRVTLQPRVSLRPRKHCEGIDNLEND